MIGYSSERSIQILLILLKKHKVKKVVVSPGSTNITLVMSMQNDPFFEMYSAPDERSAAYIACGLAAEAGEPVMLTCTGATASRNYVPGLTEAYYRKLPVLAVTSTQHMGQIGQYVPQVVDRTVLMNDLVLKSVQIPIIHDEIDAWAVNVHLNDALLELRHRGGGPVHINLTTSYPFYPADFSIKELPDTRAIYRIEHGDKFPELNSVKVAIFVGNHAPMSDSLIAKIDEFCEHYNAVVLCDHTSNYVGKYLISPALIVSQDIKTSINNNIDVLIHIGDVSGAYLSLNVKQVWRVNPDGIVRDTFKRLKYVFEFKEDEFFDRYNELSSIKTKTSYFESWQKEYNELYNSIPDIPFSNIWISGRVLRGIPSGSCLFLGILNSLRSANFYPIRKDIKVFSNTGGFGIDGGTSSLLGGAIADPENLHFGIFGDLAFFYDINVLGNRHVSNNMRILLVNNGKGTEFRNYTNFASKFQDETDTFIAAGGHYGNKSAMLVKHYAEDLGFIYISASNKQEFEDGIKTFCSDERFNKPVLFETFTTNEDEDYSLKLFRNIGTTDGDILKRATKDKIKGVLGERGVARIKKILGR